MIITKQKSEFRIWTESFAKQQSVWLYASNGTAPDEAKLCCAERQASEYPALKFKNS